MQFNAAARRYSRLKLQHQTKIFWVYTVSIIYSTFCVCVCVCVCVRACACACVGYAHSTSTAKRMVHRWAFVAAVIYLHTHVLNTVATYVFEMAKNSFCPSGGTLADSAVTSLRFSSIWLRTLLFNWKWTMPNHIVTMFRAFPCEAICATGWYQRWVWHVTRHKETQWHELSH